jgi:hypothetical protein
MVEEGGILAVGHVLAVLALLRTHYIGPSTMAARRSAAIALALSALLAGCSLSGTKLAPDGAPATTGSISRPVEVLRPLPETLAYSDAATIGEAAQAALWQADGTATGEWLNRATGSSGTVEHSSARSIEDPEHCRPFSTIVTSIGGVHHYSGNVCRAENGRSVVSIGDAGA